MRSYSGPVGCLALAVSLGLAAPQPLPSQEPAAQQLPVFGSRVEVVAVPVFVTDKAGKAVAGLTAADFEVEDQGKKVPIVAFQAVDVTSATPAAEAGALVQAAARRQFLLLFDLTFSTPSGIMKARDAAVRFVRESLAPSDLAAAATFGQAGVRVLVGFSSDREQVVRAIDSLGMTETQRLRDPLGIAYELGAPPEGPGLAPGAGEGKDQMMLEELRSLAQQMSRAEQGLYRQRVDSFLGGLGNLARMLGSVQGRKQVILLSAGFDSSILGGAQGQEAVNNSNAVVEGRLWDVQSDRYFGDSTARDTLDRLFNTLAASDTVIHGVDVAGLAAGGSVDEAVPGGRSGGGRDTVAQFAANTGGRFVKDANDLRAGLGEVLDASRYYYVVAFQPVDPDKKRDRLRKLKIRVNRDGLEVSHRRGYVLPDPKREIDPATRQLQAAETIAKGISGGPIGLSAVAVPYRNGKGRLSLPVVLQVDGAALLAGGATKQLKLEVFGYALDASGRIYDAVGITPAFDLATIKSSLAAKGLQVLTAFAVPDGPVDLRFLVREPSSGRAGSLRLLLDVPPFAAGKLVLSPPLAMDDPRARLVVPTPSRALPALEIPFRLDDTPFTAQPLPTLQNGAGRELCVLTWTGSAQYGKESQYEIEARLLDAAGAAHRLPLEGSPRVVADADGLQRYVLTLAPRSVPAGRYDLQVSFRSAATGSASSSHSPVEVR
jgi:VWFA-related protein